MVKSNKERWSDVLQGVKELSESYEDDIVFIEGVAVFFHCKKNELTKRLVFASHDADFMISKAAFIDLRDEYECNANKRLGKQEMSICGESFGIYIQREHNLIVSFEKAKEFSVSIENICMAGLEHLLPLKLVAAIDRKSSSKGQKDQRDLVCLCYLISKENNFNYDECVKYLDDSSLKHLKDLIEGNLILKICDSNSHLAKQVKSVVKETVEQLESCYNKINDLNVEKEKKHKL